MTANHPTRCIAILVAGLLIAWGQTGDAASVTCTVDWNNMHQRIDGFGASSAWQGSWTTSLADLLFSTNTGVVYTDRLNNRSTNSGVGLSLLRNHIVPASSVSSAATPGTAETNIMQMAQSRGARVWSAPWTPPAGFKDSDALNGGNYLGSAANATNLAYASQLANYVVSMKNTWGINLYALSIQNEPDINHPGPSGYETCLWTSQQIHDFATNLYNAFLARNVTSTLILMPESAHWDDANGLASATVTNPVSLADVGILAFHDYSTNHNVGETNLPGAKPDYGKPLWETEVSIINGSDSSISNGLYYAGRIHLFMTVAEANAWHYWWLVTGNGVGNQGLMDGNASTTKRLFAVGQYSRFVRPGYYRIDATNTGTAWISAYKDPVTGQFAIVAINTNTSAVAQTFQMSNCAASGPVTPWATSASLNLASQTAVAVSNSAFACTLPAQSVVTFVGQAAAYTAPALASVPDQIIGPGQTLLITNAATDAEAPPLTLTFSLLAGPGNALLGAASGVFTWRPLVSQANTTNLISVEVQDNGSPVLSATNHFTVTVNALAPSSLSAIEVSGGQVSLTASGPVGPDYTLLVSSNLVDWVALLTTHSPALPVTLQDTNDPTGAARFYRLELGP